MGDVFRVAVVASVGWFTACGRLSGQDASSGGMGGASGAPSTMGGTPSGSGGMPAATGFERRADGLVHRVRAVACENTLPRPGFNFSELSNRSCEVDEDCAELKFGFCNAYLVPGGSLAAKCVMGCVEDADCGADQICHCGIGIGTCVASTCITDDDCNGELCALVDDRGRCDDGSRGSSQFVCTTARDECLFSKNCGSFRCGVENGARTCLESVRWESEECVTGG